MRSNQLTRNREQALFLYTLALNDGNVEALETVLEMAENDPLLADLLSDVETIYSMEHQSRLDETERHKVRVLLHKHLFSDFLDVEEEEISLPTIGDVLTEIKREVQSGPLAREAGSLLKVHDIHTITLPKELSRKMVQHLFERIGLTVSQGLQNAFRNIGIHLLMQRQQQSMLQAARRQQGSHAKKGTRPVMPSEAEKGQEE